MTHAGHAFASLFDAFCAGVGLIGTATVIACCLIVPPPCLPPHDAPILRIVVTGNSGGEILPCKVCGNDSNGGIARRVALIERLRSEGIPTLTIVGEGEFTPDHPPRRPPTPKLDPSQTKRIYDALSVDVGYLTETSAAWFAAAGIDPPPSFVAVRDRPVVRRHRVGGTEVVVALLPDAVGAAKEADLTGGRKDAVVVCVCPWGNDVEFDALPGLKDRCDVLVGGGPGFDVASAVEDDGSGILWLRPDRSGMSVFTIDVFRADDRTGRRYVLQATERPVWRAMPESGHVLSVIEAD